jgi:nitroreductase
MNVIDAIQQRRAIKRFDPDFKISDTDKKNLLSSVMENAPSAFNLQHWRPVLVENVELISVLVSTEQSFASVTIRLYCPAEFTLEILGVFAV